MKINTRDPERQAWDEPANDGRIHFQGKSGKRYEVREDEAGGLVLKAWDGGLSVRPLRGNEVAFE